MLDFISSILLCIMLISIFVPGIYALILTFQIADLPLQIFTVIFGAVLILLILASLALIVFSCREFFSERKRESRQ
ncbi:hypothetical protein [Lacticaseibacillus paracasei]|uniref:hypothetical protein n=1 Tax=Lacticaseibacillus paracasei TaxID=1597 RepID=UPI0018A4B2F4|nr:hypothetical protein [Lacticaseibacillus paracasei]QOP49076.1 hypothetical protein G5C68_12875 [Lacticaseibacillus paracasei]